MLDHVRPRVRCVRVRVEPLAALLVGFTSRALGDDGDDGDDGGDGGTGTSVSEMTASRLGALLLLGGTQSLCLATD